MKKQSSEKAYSGNIGNNTGEVKEAEYCPVHPKNYCNSIKCHTCKHLKQYVDHIHWICVGCADGYIMQFVDLLPFHSSGVCDLCGNESIARVLVELKDNAYE